MSAPSPEERALRALDDLRLALADVFAQRDEPDLGPEAIVTLTAAARRLGVARSTVTRWSDDGRLRTVGPLHARRVPVAEIQRMSLAVSGPAAPRHKKAAASLRLTAAAAGATDAARHTRASA